ncbi:shikimate dehydrogenase [Candidatus Nitrosacidococcus tergens]|uniref:Shikimate dehydrogenase (NADP(+)) n=1 Tax=Candidatus Nitrosacidococcus tergens TaxID=553981 RepID=A0A7G1Q7T8_9GAMM|nr:shikimate dehydrogenase [Candidatus Nitrosacidococcus tergens]CAB1274548.1 Shikimate dehydrogenase [Candidatus Nitrosacidococcus tergens]
MVSLGLYGVMGNPIAHSQSPNIYTQFARQTKQNLIYKSILVELGNLRGAITDFYRQGGLGLNITIPFKKDAWQLVNHCSPQAQQARSVNTISIHSDGSLFGDTTDGIGLIRDITQNHKKELKNQNILLLGAGGAAASVIEPILAQSPARLVIANRTSEKAAALAHKFSGLGRIIGGGYKELIGDSFDFIINATATSLQKTLPPLPENLLNSNGWVYDMMYSNQPTVFMEWGKQQGAERTLDGLGMLVEQAAESFFIWHKIQPNTATIIAQLRAYN